MKPLKLILILCILLLTACGKAPLLEEETSSVVPLVEDVETIDPEITILPPEVKDTEDSKTEEILSPHASAVSESEADESEGMYGILQEGDREAIDAIEALKQNENSLEVASTPEGNLYKGIDFSKRGNTSANIQRNNYGMVAKSGEWVYYFEPVQSQLIRMKSDGSEKTLILQGGAYLYLNVVDDWIYYTNGDMDIWKVKTDGTGKTMLETGYVNGMIVIDNYIFYLASEGPTGSRRIKRIKTDGSDAKYLSPAWTSDPFYVDEKIYYSAQEYYYSNAGAFARQKFFCMDLNGENVREMYDDSKVSYFIHENYLYAIGRQSFDKINLIDKTVEVFSQEDFHNPSLYKDWVFYQDYYEEGEERGPKNELYVNTATLRRVKLDGSETHLVSDIQVWHYMIVDEEWVYYFPLYEIYKVDPEVMVMRRVRWDGTDDQALTPVETEAGSGE